MAGVTRTVSMTGRGLGGLLLAFPTALFPAALIADIAYLQTAEIQWSNFASWLIAGALVFLGVVLAWAAVATLLSLARPGAALRWGHVLVLAVLFVFGLFNAFKHSQDGWSSVGGLGVTLSVICTLLALFSAAVTYSGFLVREDAR